MDEDLLMAERSELIAEIRRLVTDLAARDAEVGQLRAAIRDLIIECRPLLRRKPTSKARDDAQNAIERARKLLEGEAC